MKSITVLIVSIVGLVYCVVATTPSTYQLYSVCETTLDWLRTDENALTHMKQDEAVSSEFIRLVESDESSEYICDLLAVRSTGNEFFLGHIAKIVGTIIKVASGAARVAGRVASTAGRVAGRVASNAGKFSKAAKAINKGAKFGRKVGRAIRDHDDKRKRRRHSMIQYA